MKKIYLYGNWKMNMNCAETEKFFGDLAKAVAPAAGDIGSGLEIAVFPPFTSIWAGKNAAAANKCSVIVGAQDVYFEASGAFTGEVSASMLLEAGVTHVIIGHSERRHIILESDELIAKKTKACLDNGIVPVLCYGETLDEREGGDAFKVMERQLRSALAGLSKEQAGKIIYAYEPVWAIGTGKAATPEQAEEVCAWSKKLLAEFTDVDPVVLYGGSVKGSNAAEILSKPSIDGALVGGASMKAGSFIEIYTAYKEKCN